MKVLIIAPNTKKESGGWGRYTYEVVEHLKRQGVQVTFDKKDSYDVVHALEMGIKYGLPAFFASIKRNKKLVLSGIGTYSVAPLSKWFQKIVMRVIVHRASKVVCISDYTRDQIKKYLPHAKTETVLMGLTKLKSNTPKVVSNNPVILTVGDVKERKGQVETYKAVLSLKDKYPDILYVTIGSQSDKGYVNKIKSLGTDNLLMLEKISDEELASWYARADVFCLNSNNDDIHRHFEGFGLVILEAGQFGVPSVGSRNCGVESAIKDGVNGYLSNQKDIFDIANKVEKTLTLDRQKVIEFTYTFDWDKTVKRYIEIYQGEHL